MLWLPAVSADVAQVALAELTACAVQPEMETPLFVKPTVPVGALPVMVAVNVTLAPNVDGFAELVIAVVVDVPPPRVTCTVIVPDAPGEAESTLIVTPYWASTYAIPGSSAALVKGDADAGVMSRISVSSEPEDDFERACDANMQAAVRRRYEAVEQADRLAVFDPVRPVACGGRDLDGVGRHPSGFDRSEDVVRRARRVRLDAVAAIHGPEGESISVFCRASKCPAL